MTKLSHPGSLPHLPGRPFPTGSDTQCPSKGPAGKVTQLAFHEVQEHPNRNSDERVMTFRSWRSCRILAGRNPSGGGHPGEPSQADPAGVHQPGVHQLGRPIRGAPAGVHQQGRPSRGAPVGRTQPGSPSTSLFRVIGP